MSQTPSQPTNEKNGFLRLLIALKNLLLHNWASKLLALVLAIVLWAGLITQDPSLTREKRFNDVRVTIGGTDTLKRNGFIVTSDLDALLDDVTLTVDVPQMQYANAQATNYSVRVDLTRIAESGTQELKVLTTNSSTYGTVKSVEPSTITVNVDDYVTRYRIPVSPVETGEEPEGYYAQRTSMSPAMVAVSGPRTIVEQIARAEVAIPQDTLPTREGTIRRAVPLTLVDDQGNPIKSKLLQVTSESVLVDSIVVEQELYMLKQVPLSDVGVIRGEPAQGYEIKSWKITPDMLTIAAPRDTLSGIDAMFTDSYVDVTGMTDSINKSLRVRLSDVEYSSATTASVVVEIGPVITQRTFSNLRMHVENVSDAYYASTNVNKSGVVSISGPQLWVETLRDGDVTLFCDAEGLTAGVYDLPLQCEILGSQDKEYTVEIEPRTVRVIITENEW